MDENLKRLSSWFHEFKSCIVAFSGGVDSSLLALAARKALQNNSHAVTSISKAFAASELEEARRAAQEIGIELIEVRQDDLNDQNYVKNEVSRCYFCRSNLAEAIRPVVNRLSIDVCVDGTHLDDLERPRPGVKALRENGFRAPLVELSFGKSDIREMAKYSGLSNWDRPSEACLSSRVAYNQEISFEKLQRIEMAEKIVKKITKAEIVRVRTIGDNALVEVDQKSVAFALNQALAIREQLKKVGYGEVEVDPRGYASGKMLELFLNSTEK